MTLVRSKQSKQLQRLKLNYPRLTWSVEPRLYCGSSLEHTRWAVAVVSFRFSPQTYSQHSAHHFYLRRQFSTFDLTIQVETDVVVT